MAVTNTAREDVLLPLVLDELIPGRADGRLPGAGALGLAFVVVGAFSAAPELRAALADGLAALDDLARARDAGGFGALSRVQRVETLKMLEAREVEFFSMLSTFAFGAYYTNERVVAVLTNEDRAPHPRGYEVEPDDLSLLDAVRARGKLYRDV